VSQSNLRPLGPFPQILAQVMAQMISWHGLVQAVKPVLLGSFSTVNLLTASQVQPMVTAKTICELQIFFFLLHFLDIELAGDKVITDLW